VSSIEYRAAPLTEDDLDVVQPTLRQEQILLKKKASMLASGRLEEEKTEKLTLKLEPTLKELYHKAPDNVKALARKAMRRALKTAVLSYWLEDFKPSSYGIREDCNVNINMTVYESNTGRQNTITIEELQAVIEDLRRLKRILEHSSAAPLQRELVENALNRLSRLLS